MVKFDVLCDYVWLKWGCIYLYMVILGKSFFFLGEKMLYIVVCYLIYYFGGCFLVLIYKNIIFYIELFVFKWLC